MEHASRKNKSQTTDLVRRFRSKAEHVSAIVEVVDDVASALDYAVEICTLKEACTLLPSGCEADLSAKAQTLCDEKPAKVIAAPDLNPSHGESLASLCRAAGIHLVTQGLRSHLGGIDIGLTWARYGIADTGTLVIDSTDEDLRLATMISEIHVAMLPIAAIRDSSTDLEKELRARMQGSASYLAMITGASRTADIERVLALGVHGPLELHILLVGEEHV